MQPTVLWHGDWLRRACAHTLRFVKLELLLMVMAAAALASVPPIRLNPLKCCAGVGQHEGQQPCISS